MNQSLLKSVDIHERLQILVFSKKTPLFKVLNRDLNLRQTFSKDSSSTYLKATSISHYILPLILGHTLLI